MEGDCALNALDLIVRLHVSFHSRHEHDGRVVLPERDIASKGTEDGGEEEDGPEQDTGCRYDEPIYPGLDQSHYLALRAADLRVVVCVSTHVVRNTHGYLLKQKFSSGVPY